MRNLFLGVIISSMALIACTEVDATEELILPPTNDSIPLPTDSVPSTNDSTPPISPYPFRVLVANEGQFTYGTASLTGITKTGEVFKDIFRRTNNRPLGDIAHSILQIEDKLYVTLNNSKKIEVMNARTFNSLTTILTPPNFIPTYMCHLGGDSMAVADIVTGNGKKLLIVDLKSNTVTREIEDIGTGGQMIVHEGKLYLGNSPLRIFDLENISKEGMRRIKDKNIFLTAWNESKIILDKNNKIWVFHDGVLTGGKRLVCIDPASETIVKQIQIKGATIGSFPRLDISPEKDVLYLTGAFNKVNGIIAIGIDAEVFPTALHFSTANEMPSEKERVLYNMSVSKEGTIFICDVLYGSIASGYVHEYQADGTHIRTVSAGIFPQYLFFY
ncbi:MAG: DUF5074 domain-containing protein [Bacteroidales bacterium]